MSNVAQRSFAAGEIAPALHARTDQVRYATGLATCRNFLVLRAGGAANRAGTLFVDETVEDTSQERLVPFEFTSEQTYVLEFSDLQVRVLQDGGVVVEGIVTPYVAADLMALRLVQSGDIITITHPSYPPAELRRTDHTTWTHVEIDFGPSIDPPTGLAIAGTGAPFTDSHWYKVTAVKEDTGEESLASDPEFSGFFTASPTAPNQVTWDAVAGASAYRVYRQPNTGDPDADYYFIGEASHETFSDTGILEDPTRIPPVARDLFDAADEYPTAVGYYQQRLLLANTNTNPATCYASRIGDLHNYRLSTPIREDDPVTFSLAGKKVQQIQHILDVSRLVLFTSNEEKEILGDGSEAAVLTPAAVNPRKISAHGSGQVAPLEVGDTALFVQARGTIIRDLFAKNEDGTSGTDLTIFSSHLFDGYTIVDWAYQEAPNSVVWVVRSDGVLLGLTYIREQAMVGWSRHDADNGTYENVCVVPEGNEDAVYVIVRREVGGITKRFVERFKSRLLAEQPGAAGATNEEAWFVDAGLEYDGRDYGAGSITITLSGASFDEGDSVTATASAAVFTAGDVGNEIVLHDNADEDNIVIGVITGYTSTTVVTVDLDRDAGAAFQATAITLWDRAVDVVAGLSHLEDEAVSVFADGNVVASPYNSAYDEIVVAGGEITLPECYALIRVGLPYISDLETLDIDTTQGPSLKNRKMKINRVTLQVEASRGVFVGPEFPTGDDALDGLDEMQLRDEEDYDDPMGLISGELEATLESSWESSGRIVVRQVDPLPLTVLAAIPQGFIPS